MKLMKLSANVVQKVEVGFLRFVRQHTIGDREIIPSNFGNQWSDLNIRKS